jgi:hypothetical protein
MIIYTPYTYLIGWSKLNKWYYGVRFAKGCRPDDLWVSYYTSSKYVKTFRKENGEPDVILIRRTFSDRRQALEWEHKVLRRMKVTSKDAWLNKTDNRSIINDRYMLAASHSPIANSKRSTTMCKKVWITNGNENKRIGQHSFIPEGWYAGRSNLKRTFTSSQLESVSKLGLSNSREVLYAGVRYYSMKSASRSTGISVYKLKSFGATFI